MKYFKVKKESGDIKCNIRFRNVTLIAHELFTAAEIDKALAADNITLTFLNNHFVEVEIKKQNTYFAFGARFERRKTEEQIKVEPQTASGYLHGLMLPLRYHGGVIKDGAGKIIMHANRQSGETPLNPAGRDAILQLACVLLNESFEYDKARQILKKLGY